MGAPTHTLGGKAFREARKSTLEHDSWAMDKLRACGLFEIEPAEGEDIGDFGVRLTEAMHPLKMIDVLGGLLVPEEIEDLDWTPAVAGNTVKFLRNLSEQEDKEAVHVLFGRLVAGFFVDGVLSHGTSRSYFAASQALSATSEIAAT